jgi:hypothetical protein
VILLPLVCRFLCIRSLRYFSLFSFLVGPINRIIKGWNSLPLFLFLFVFSSLERVRQELFFIFILIIKWAKEWMTSVVLRMSLNSYICFVSSRSESRRWRSLLDLTVACRARLLFSLSFFFSVTIFLWHHCVQSRCYGAGACASFHWHRSCSELKPDFYFIFCRVYCPRSLLFFLL